MVWSKTHILEMRKARSAVKTLPVLNSILFFVLAVFLVFYIMQVNFIYGSSSTIDDYKQQMHTYREQNVELQEYVDLVYDLEPLQVKRRLGMVEGQTVDSVRVDTGDVAVVTN